MLAALFASFVAFVEQLLSQHGYAAAFTVLLLCGLGLPLPEEVTLIGSGILYYKGDVQFLPIVLVCSAAILLGDSIPFWLGRKYGLRALRIKWVTKIVHPERFARLERRFEDHGTWGTFGLRFLPGIRIPGYFVAGTLGMRYPRFLILDTLGVALSVPISIYLGKVFGGEIDRLKETLADLHLLLGFLVVALALTIVIRARVRKRQERAERAEAARMAAEAGALAMPPGDPPRAAAGPDSSDSTGEPPPSRG